MEIENVTVTGDQLNAAYLNNAVVTVRGDRGSIMHLCNKNKATSLQVDVRAGGPYVVEVGEFLVYRLRQHGNIDWTATQGGTIVGILNIILQD